MSRFSRVYAKIDLTAAMHNLESIHGCSQNAQIIAVVKTDAYGHGAAELAKKAEELDYLFGFAVATAPEAFQLRDAGIKKPILILGYVFEEHYDELAAQDIRVTVFTLEMAEQLSKAAVRAGRDIFVHIKIDTGMSRIGMQVTEENAKIIAQIASLEHIIAEGIFTHFAKADETDKTASDRQLEQFLHMVRLTEKEGVTIPYRHCANSAAIIDLPDAQLDIVRAGIILYGLWPSDEVQKSRIGLHPVLELKSHIPYGKDPEAGRGMSYGGTYTTKEPRKIATIPVGYGDGYPRSLSNKGQVLIHGHRAPVAGRICMDQFMVDVTDIPDAAAGDEVTLIGRDGGDSITVEELAGLSGRFPYEFVCGIGKRVPRVFYENGQPVSERSPFS